MGFDIPEPYVWDESFKVFYDTLDRQHQQLFQKIFKLSACKDDRRELDHFKRVISEHFSQEEELMSKADYADYDIHHMEHQEFLRIIRTFATPVTSEQVRWIKDWLVNHIKGTDLQYKGKL